MKNIILKKVRIALMVIAFILMIAYVVLRYILHRDDWRFVVQVVMNVCLVAVFIISYLESKTNVGKNEAADLYNLGWEFQYGKNRKQDFQLSAKYYLQAAEMGHAAAQCNIGYYYCQGIGVKQNIEKGLAWTRKGAEGGNKYAQYNLACDLIKKGQVDEGISWLEKAARKWHPDAILTCGIAYSGKMGIEKNMLRALGYLLLALFTKNHAQVWQIIGNIGRA